jgi:hypothetical protein
VLIGFDEQPSDPISESLDVLLFIVLVLSQSLCSSLLECTHRTCFADADRPAVYLPEQVEVLAHGVSSGILFSRSLQILVLPRLLQREIVHLTDRR